MKIQIKLYDKICTKGSYEYQRKLLWTNGRTNKVNSYQKLLLAGDLNGRVGLEVESRVDGLFGEDIINETKIFICANLQLKDNKYLFFFFAIKISINIHGRDFHYITNQSLTT